MNRRGRALLAAGILAAWALLALVAARGSLLGDEAFYAGVALESQRTDRSFPLAINGEPYVEKPPLPIWLVGLSLAHFGHSAFAARLPALLAGLVTVTLLAGGVARRAGPAAGAAAALLLAALPTANGLEGHHGLASATGDALLLLLVTSALLGLAGSFRWRPLLVLGASFLAAWTKGAAGPAFLTLAIPVFAHAARDDRERAPGAARRWVLPFAAVASAWVGWVTWVAGLALADVPRLFARLVEKGIVRRLVEGLDATHRQGPTFYFEVLARDFGPGLSVALFAVTAAIADRRGAGTGRLRRAAAIVATLWILALSLPVSKLGWYLLPAYPLLAGLTLDACAEFGSGTRGWRRTAAVAAALLVLGWPVAGTVLRLAGPEPVHPLDGALRELAAEGIDRVAVDPALGFGRRHELDATAYFLAESLRGAQVGKQAPGPASPCRGLLTVLLADDAPPAGAGERDRVWNGPLQPSGRAAALYRLCPRRE